MAVPFLARASGPINRRAFVSPDWSTNSRPPAIYLSNQLVKLKSLNPFLRNDNVTTSPLEIKAGPNTVMKQDDGTWTMWFESIQNTGFPANNGMTAFMRATAPKLQGPWTITPTTLVLAAADTTTWEYYEFSPANVFWDAANSRLVMWVHGGNNNGPRQGGLAYSTDGKTGITWTKEASNPVIPAGATGAFDDKQAGGDLKWAQNPVSGLWVGFYRAQQVGGPADGTVGRVTGGNGAIPATPVVKTGQVISTVPSWNSGGITSGSIYYDANGRLHGFFPTGPNGIGYVYSDNDGIDWKGGLQVAAPSGVAGAYDKVSIGDVVTGVLDGDVVWMVCGTENIVDYPTNNPMRGQSMLITPWRVQNPARRGKFYLNGAYTSFTASSLLNQTTYSIMGRFKGYEVDRSVPRHIYTEFAAFNKQIYLRFGNGSGGGGGLLELFHRTPTALVNFASSATYDDGQWHTFLIRRISSASFEIYVDGSLVGSSAATDPTTDATATKKAIGNYDASGNGANQPFLGTISDVGVATGYAASASEATAWINSRTALGGGAITFDSQTSTVTDFGDVALVEAASPATSLAIGIATTTNTALAPPLSLGIGTAAATNTAFTGALSLGISPANDNEAALAPGIALRIAPTTETDTALPLAPGGAGIAPALEADAALPRAFALGVLPATSSSTALAPALKLGVAPANENDTALFGGVLFAPGLETDSTFAPARRLGILPATSSSAALAPALKLGGSFALETDLALGPPQGPVAVPPADRIGQVHRIPRVAQVRR